MKVSKYAITQLLELTYQLSNKMTKIGKRLSLIEKKLYLSKKRTETTPLHNLSTHGQVQPDPTSVHSIYTHLQVQPDPTSDHSFNVLSNDDSFT